MNQEKGYNEQWVDYYVYLENLRKSGVTNMFGASPYLAEEFSLGNKEAIKILSSWMDNYDELLKDNIFARD